MHKKYDAVIVGAGPNGLAAAITMVRAGLSTLIIEKNENIGGGVRSAELTLPGFIHDTGAALFPLTASSPFFRPLPLHEYGLEWVFPEASVAHPLDDGTAVILQKSIERTAETLGDDAVSYKKIILPLLHRGELLGEELMGTFRMPHHPLASLLFARNAIRSTWGFSKGNFKGARVQALFAGLGAHSIRPLESPSTAAFSLWFAVTAHMTGWPFVKGGAVRLTEAMADYFRSLGGEIAIGQTVNSLDELPPGKVYLFDTDTIQLLKIAGERLSPLYRRQVQRYRYGPGVFKIDWALDRPIPWKAKGCLSAGTIHIGGTIEEITRAERMVWQGEVPEYPFVILAQPTLFDGSRAPEGKHVAWAYCHVPNGSSFDMTARIEAQIERFAPGFGDTVLARKTMSPADLQRDNPNLVGGDISGGAQIVRQLLFRPAVRYSSYNTSARNIFICSSSAVPGAGVHGMCGYHAAREALRLL